MENNRSTTLGYLLEYLDGRGLVIEDENKLLEKLTNYLDLTYETTINWHHEEN